MTAAAEPIEIRRKRLRYRSWHRGMKEVDLLLGRFADAHLDGFGEAELDAFERILGENDPDLYAWLAGRKPVPADLESPMIRILKNFQYSFEAQE